MATRGWEFAYMLDGGSGTPVIRDFILSTAAAHKVGDLMVLETDGDLTQAAATATEVTAVCQEAVAAACVKSPSVSITIRSPTLCAAAVLRMKSRITGVALLPPKS